ncbi:TPA: histidine phosphatase family protein [Escherichia coli]|nr:histidine phosphatase family protein [Escherichia coli]
MIQTRNQYLQFMLVMLAAWGISWGARFVMEQAVLLYGSGKNYLFFSHGTVLMYLLCVFLVYRRWIAPQRWRTVAGRCDGRGVCRCISAR